MKIKDGSAAAAILAAGIGLTVTGIMTTMSEVSAKFSAMLVWSNPVGALSGKTIIGIAAWIVSWIIFGRLWKDRDVSFKTVLVVSTILMAAGLLLTFPPVFDFIKG
jgi:hypothetical protein